MKTLSRMFSVLAHRTRIGRSGRDPDSRGGTGRKYTGRGERGIVAVELAIVLPVFTLMIFGIVQFGSILFLHNNMVNAAREATRLMSVEEATAAQAITKAQDYLAGWGLTFAVTPTNNCPATREVSVRISTDASAASFVDIAGFMVGKQITAEVTMRREAPCP